VALTSALFADKACGVTKNRQWELWVSLGKYLISERSRLVKMYNHSVLPTVYTNQISFLNHFPVILAYSYPPKSHKIDIFDIFRLSRLLKVTVVIVFCHTIRQIIQKINVFSSYDSDIGNEIEKRGQNSPPL